MHFLFDLLKNSIKEFNTKTMYIIAIVFLFIVSVIVSYNYFSNILNEIFNKI